MLLKCEKSTNDVTPLQNPTDEMFTRVFCSITDIDVANKRIPHFDNRWDNVISDINITDEEVRHVIKLLDPNKAVGHDIISNKMLLAVRNAISKPLALLFGSSLQESWSSSPTVF